MMAANRTVLSPKVLTGEGVYGLSVIRVHDDGVEVEPFERETPATVFVPSPVAILKTSVITEFLLDDIAAIMGEYPLAAALEKLHTLFSSSALYFINGDSAERPAVIELH